MRLGRGLTPVSSAAQAAGQAGMLFALSGLSAFAGILSQPRQVGLLTTIGIADLICAGVAWLLPWDRWSPRFTALLALPGFAVLGLSTWTFGGFAAGTGPFFVLVFVWLGLHHPRWVILANAAPASLAYLAPLIVVGSPPELLFSAVVLIPVGVAVGLAIASQVESVREERDRAQRAEGWRSALMATLAHDIRSPLTAVQGTLMLFEEMPELPEEHRRRLLGSALRQTRRITRLATGLLDIERVEQGQLRLDRRLISLAQVARDAGALAAAGSEITVAADPELRVYADPERLEQILINLITNAVRHGRPPVVVSGENADEGVRIEVRDPGPGVAPHRREALFQRLGGDADHPESVGLGMWIVRLLVEAHGGTATYEPAQPGARFVVLLPHDRTPRTAPKAGHSHRGSD